MTPVEDGCGYSFGPFLLHSEIDLADLRLARRSTGLPVQVRLEAAHLNDPGLNDPGRASTRLNDAVLAGPQFCALTVPGLATFAVRGGTHVSVEREQGADLRDLQGYLTAWVFGVLCHQNGMLPLHASAVARDGRATAFLGDSGTGKSTFAAFLGRRGYSLCSDDICLLRETPESMDVVPVAAWLKLWRGTLDALGEPVEGENQTFSDEDKYRVYGADPGLDVAEPVPALGDLVFVERGEAPARLEPMSNAATLARMFGTVYLGYCMQAMQVEERVVRQCARVAGQARGWLLTAPWGFDQMPAVLDLLEAQVLRVPGR